MDESASVTKLPESFVIPLPEMIDIPPIIIPPLTNIPIPEINLPPIIFYTPHLTPEDLQAISPTPNRKESDA